MPDVTSQPPHEPAPPAAAEHASAVVRMFDRIAPRYDRVNRTLSLCQDRSWRHAVAHRLANLEHELVVDLATGTGDQLLYLARHLPPRTRLVGLDASAEMLAVGRRKLAALGFDDRHRLLLGDAHHLPFDDGSVGAVTCAFGIRNMEHVDRALRECHRVLAPGGRLVVLEFSLPPQPLIRKLYLCYFRHVLPGLAHLLTGQGDAYHYLNRTVEAFPCGEAFCVWLRAAGFQRVTATPLTLGVATLYEGHKA